MTRSNLEQHLSWLLSEKPSVPAETNLFTAHTIAPAGTVDGFVDDPERQIQYPASNESRPVSSAGRVDDMVRVRTTPSSASRHVAFASPSLPRSPPSADPRITSPSESRRLRNFVDAPATGPSARSINLNTAELPNDIEIMDLTDSLSDMDSSQPKQAVTPKIERKRKSEDLESDNDATSAPARRPSYPSRHQSGVAPSFAAIDDLCDRHQSPQKVEHVPTDPPPPYSTIPPKPRTPKGAKGALGVIAEKISSPGTKFSSRQPGGVIDPEEDDIIVNFYSQKPRYDQKPKDDPTASLPNQERVVASNVTNITRIKMSPSCTGEGVKRPIVSELASTPAPSALVSTQEVSSEDSLLLKSVFNASDALINKALQIFETRRDSICEEVADRMDQDLDASHLENELDEIDKKKSAIGSLWSKRVLYQRLSGERDRLKTALVQAVKSRQGTEAAKAANTAGKAKFQKLETDCVELLKFCKPDVTIILRQSDLGSNRSISPNFDVKSTHPAVQEHDHRSIMVASSSRVCQTQVHPSTMPLLKHGQDGTSDSDFGDHIEPLNLIQNSTKKSKVLTAHENSTRHINDYEDNDVGWRRSTSKNLFSNRMGTPPGPYDEDDDFGINNDDEMLEFAEDLENHCIRPTAFHETSPRPVFAETSANSQVKHHAALKTKMKGQSQRSVDMEKHFIYPWSNDVKTALKERFKLKGFRQCQVEAINATLSGKDAFVLMPTGGGKSLCYQLPSLVRSGKTRGVTVVVSPLMSLMEDQVQHLRDLHIQAFLFNSETTAQERNTLLDGLRDMNVEKYIQVLYVTPELLGQNQRMLNALNTLYNNQRMARLVIDEAHCVSQWGHDFRPDYKALGGIRRQFPGVPVMALTATATENVKVDTIHNLNMGGCEIFTRSFNRANLYYEVRLKGKGKESLESIASLIKDKHSKQTGIIYCLSRKNCEDMASALQNQHRIKAQHYHAGMPSAEKLDVQRKWQAGAYHVIVATIAFGMGIDKANVRFVIHHSLPKSLEGYYQETGRAGRDGLRSDCYLFYGYGDSAKLRRMIEDGEGNREQKDRQHQMLRKMIQFSENRLDCRREQILAYFNEAFDQTDCHSHCDNCNSNINFQTVDFTSYAQRAVSLVRALESDKVTILHCIEVFRGADTKKVKTRKDNMLDDYGAGSDLDRGDVERLFYRLAAEGALSETQTVNKAGFANQHIALGRDFRAFESGQRSLEMQVRMSPRAKTVKAAVAKKNTSEVDSKELHQSKKKNAVKSMAVHDLPLSTNVSSPVQAASIRGKATRQPKREDLHASGYGRDGFVISDPEDNPFVADDSESDSDAFEPVRAANQRVRNKEPRQLGPPITTDFQMEGVNSIHRMVVEQFVAEAESVGKSIMNNKNLHFVPFSNTILRQMAIDFTETPEDMLAIHGIEPERVRLYGKQFCALVKQYHRNYDEMMAENEISNDKHNQNVIDLISDEEGDDDEDDEYGSLPSSAEPLEEDEAEQSTYFQTSDDVAAFNANFRHSQSAEMSIKPTALAPKKAGVKKRTYRARGSTSTTARRRSHFGSRAASKDFNEFRYKPSGEKGGSSRASASRPRKQKAAAGSSRASAKQSRPGGGAISMMPT